MVEPSNMDIVYMPFKKIFSYGFNTNGTLYDTAAFTLFLVTIYEMFPLYTAMDICNIYRFIHLYNHFYINIIHDILIQYVY